MNHLMRLLREPLFHFLIIGSLLFVLFNVLSGPESSPVDTIVVSPERVTQLASGFEIVRKRLPTDEELRALVDNFIREEVYYREALALGLDSDDRVIRRRLQQKMEYLTDAGAEFLEPQTGELEEYYKTNVSRFQQPPLIAITQIFLGQKPASDRISETLAILRSDTETNLELLGEPTMLPRDLRLSASTEIDSMFGTGFFDGLMQIPVDEWSEPIQSGYGLHLVRITDRVPALVPPLDEVRDKIEREWRSEKLKELHGLVYDQLLQRYTLEIPEHITVKN